MRIAIVGAGFTGLSAAFYLSKAGHDVEIFEASNEPGGLASGFQQTNWDWSVEKHYHHLFRSDTDFQELLNLTGLRNRLQYYDVKTSTLFNGKMWQLDSPISLLQCGMISLISRVRTGLTLATLKILPWSKRFDEVTAKEFILRTMGKEVWTTLWEPLFIGKFGEYADKVNASWFWARIHVRSQQLGYLDGGFGKIAQEIVSILKEAGVKIYFSSSVEKINKTKNIWTISVKNKKDTLSFDKVLVTGPHTLLHSLVPQLDQEFTKDLNSLKSLGAMTLVLELNEGFFQNNNYWLNVNEKNWPFLAVVEHTNMAPSEKYGNKHLLYVGKYLKPNEKQFSLTKEQIIKLYSPFLSKLNPSFSKKINQSWLFKEYYAQPVVEKNHYKNLPGIKTPMQGLYWASMHHVYPWDRGTNYAIQLGKKVAELMK